MTLTVIFIGPACTCTLPSLSGAASTVAMTPPTFSRRTRSPLASGRTSSAVHDALLDAPALLVLGLGDDAAQSRLCGGEILFARLLLRLLLERFQLVEHGLRRHARVLEDVVRLAARTLHHLIRPFLGGVALGAHLIALGLGGAPHALRLLLHLLDAAALALKLSQNVLKACILGSKPAPSRGR